MPTLVDPAALQALVPPGAISYALEHRHQLRKLLATTDAGGSSATTKEDVSADAFRLSYQSAFEDALRQSLPTDSEAEPQSKPQPEPEPEPEPQPQPTAPTEGEPWPTVRPCNWPARPRASPLRRAPIELTHPSVLRRAQDSRKPPTAVDSQPAKGPKPDTVLWTSRDRRTQPDAPPPANTWGLAEDSPQAMLKELHGLGAGLDAVDENGWTCLMWCASTRELSPD